MLANSKTSRIPVYVSFIILLILLVFSLTSIPHVKSQSSEEIQEEIDSKEQDLKLTEEELNNLKNQLANNATALENATEGLPRVKAELKEIELQLQINEKELKVLKNAQEISELEKEKLQINQEKSLETTYKDWRLTKNNELAFLNSSKDVLKRDEYNNRVFGVGNLAMNGLQNKLSELNNQIGDYDSIVSKLSKQNEDLLAKKKKLEEEIVYFNSALAYGTNQVSSLEVQKKSIQDQIDLLTAEQKAAADREDQITGNNPVDITPDPISGGFYFSGSGRDLYQGHGVGLSQWGAYGGAQNGMSYQQIVNFYYPNTSLGQKSGTVNVIGGPQNLNIEEYVKRIGEVPDKACGSQSQVNSNPSKYALYNPNNSWSCWPEEAIKAQIVIARSYALYHKNVYPDTRSQVWDPSRDKTWAQQETAGVTVLYQGSAANTLYSSDNSQGYGTANNDTIFQNVDGTGWPVAYLRAVNDSSFATKTSWTNWGYNTGSYTKNNLKELLNFTANGNSGYSSSVRDYIRNIYNNIDTIESLSFERDPSQRVVKVRLNAKNGYVGVIGGWWFKNIWNTWVYEKGTLDYIYSQTYFLQQF